MGWAVPPVVFSLAQARSNASDYLTDILPALGALLVAIIVVGVIGLMVRRWYFHGQSHRIDEGFTLSDLRRMHHEGHLSDVEYERAKAKVIDAARGVVPPEEAGDQAAEDGVVQTDTDHDPDTDTDTDSDNLSDEK